MGERLNCQPLGCGKASDNVCCITANKIFDSAKDKDCLEDIRVYLCECAQELIDRATAVRCKGAEVMTTDITIDPVPFNKGFYQVLIRYYLCITVEVCVCGKSYEVKGLAVYDKKIILFGSEKNVSVFTSDPENNGFCKLPPKLKCENEPELPTVTVEVAPPICLDVKLVERCRNFGNCCCNIDSLPDGIKGKFDGCLVDGAGVNELFVSVGIFSVIRMERPVQIIIPASRFCLPEKDSTPAISSSDPCNVFGRMHFPMDEFFPYADTGDSRYDRGDKGDRGGCCK
ncbi:MAG: hypothetical protein IJB65_08340 [Clostridia bacterium]|nr:hypothetical protein [Clostridia bacterium]